MNYVLSPDMEWARGLGDLQCQHSGAPGQFRSLAYRFQIHRSRSSLRVGCIDCFVFDCSYTKLLEIA